MTETTDNTRVVNPELRLEDLRNKRKANVCHGRGRHTAAARGYNAELLARAVFDKRNALIRTPQESWIDVDAQVIDDSPWLDIEAKSCVDRYQKQNGEQGRYGRFKIWKPHHDKLLEYIDSRIRNPIYFFVVYTIDTGVEHEIGKLVAPVALIDSVLDNWRTEDHVTMGEIESREISWRLLLKRLGVSRNRFEDADIIDLTNE